MSSRPKLDENELNLCNELFLFDFLFENLKKKKSI